MKTQDDSNFPLADAGEILHAPAMHRWLPALLLIALLAGFRVLGSAFPDALPNLQPLPAIFLCSLIFLKGRERWLLPLTAWLFTDPIASLVQGHPIVGWHNLGVILGIGATALIATSVRRRPTALPVLLSAAGAAFAFYLLANSVAFATDVLYPKNFEGFVQAQWSGPSGFGPTWIFLRNLLVANVVFTGVFLAARVSLPQASPSSAEAFSR